ncbi:translocation/assembly module TamB domain-containing protein [Thioalkalivibrio sp.]|uniref:translocation/assembly module TamB domain-containing protein n=1 Tax=Thioalkalivibrio sp. TaxID=2093813 RepID=UPI00356A2EC2
MRRSLRIVLGLLGWVLILVLLVLAGAVALVATEDGTRWLFAQAERHAPVEFRVDTVDGTLFRGLSLTGLEVESAGTRVFLEQGRVRLDAVPLLRLTVRFPELSLAGLSIELPEPETEPPEAPEPRAPLVLPDAIELPVTVAIERFVLADLLLLRGGETLLEVDRLALRLDAGPEALRLSALEFMMPGVEARADAELRPAGAYPVRAEGQWRASLPEAPAAALGTTHAEGELVIDGNLLGSLVATHDLQAGVSLDTRLTAEDLLGTPQVRLHNQWTAFEYRIDPETAAAIDGGEITLHGGLEDWTATAATAAQLTGLPAVRLEAALDGSMEQIAIEALDLRSDAGQASLRGQVGLGETLTWELQAGIRGLSAQAFGLEPEATIETLLLDSAGSLPQVPDPGLEDRLLAIAASMEISELRARVAGQDLEGRGRIRVEQGTASIEELLLRLGPEGILRASGEAQLGAETPFDLSLSADALDLGFLLPERQLALDRLRFAAAGRIGLETRDLQAEINLTELTGRVDGQPVDGIAAAAVNGQRIRIDRLDLGVGANRITARGDIDEILALELAVDAPELDRILPELAGRIQLDAELSGTMESPRVTATGEGSGLRYAEFGLDGLQLRLDAGLDPEAPAELDLRLSGIQAAAQNIEEVRATADGRASDHRLTLAVDAADLGRVELQASGGYELDRSRWDGRLERLDIAQTLAGEWALREPVRVSASPERAALGELCLGREEARLCLQGDWEERRGGQARASLEDADLAWLSPLLPPETAIEGLLNARLRASVDPAGRLQAELDVPPAAGQVAFAMIDGTTKEIPYRDLRLAVRVDDRSVDADGGLSFLDEGDARATLQLRPEGGSFRIDGELRAGLDSLEWTGALSREVQDVRGRLLADLQIGGLLEAPQLSGDVRLEEFSARIIEAGITLEVPRLVAEAVSAEEMRLDGELRSGGESLYLEGELVFQDQQPQAGIRIRGERFLAVDRSDIRARISPELNVEFRPELLTVRGEIVIPSAMIRPPDLPPGSVPVSQDEVVVGEEAEPEAALPMDIRVRVILGDDVRFDGFDLEARFAGDLDLVDIPGRPLQLFGDIEVPEGSYQSWGQDLSIERGLVIFQGPVDSPQLDLRAVRRVPAHDVVVGVEIGGTPDALSSQVFSEPPMDDTEAMAFLLTGRPLSGASESDGNLIAGAAAAWGLEQAGLITQRLGSELGLEVELDTEGGLDESVLTIGTYLSPRLLLSYGIGLFDGGSQVMLRYELTRSLSVETTSSADEQGIDLIYRIER